MMNHARLLLALLSVLLAYIPSAVGKHFASAEDLRASIERSKLIIAQLQEKIDDDYDPTSQNIDRETLKRKKKRLKEREAQYECMMRAQH